MNKRLLWNLFQYVLAFGLLAFVIWRSWGDPGTHGLGDVWRHHVTDGEPVHWEYLLPGFAVFLVAITMTLIRWYLLVRAQGLSLTLSNAFRLGMIGIYYNAFLPGSVGGDIIKAAALARGQERRTVAVATVIMDRVIALWGLIWFVAILGSIFWLCGWLDSKDLTNAAANHAALTSRIIVTSALGIVGVSVVVWLVMGRLSDERSERFAQRLAGFPKVGHSVAELWRAVWMYRRRQLSVALTLVISWVGHVAFVVAFWCCAHSLYKAGSHDSPTLIEHFLIVPIGLVFQAVVPLPGGIGAGEFGFGTLYELFGSDKAQGVLASLVFRAMGWTAGLVGFAVTRWYARAQAARQQTPAQVSVPEPAGAAEPWEQSTAEGVSTT